MLASLRHALASQRYFSVTRRCVCTESEDHVQFFVAALGERAVITDQDALAPHNVDWMHKFKGSSKLMLKPANAQEVSAVLRHCSAHGIRVVPQGGNTGLAGGSVPVHDEVIINLSRLNRIIKLNPAGVLVCEAGCILEQLDDYVAGEGFAVPLDLGAKGSCQIGGNLATNAGGLRFLRYGSLRGSVLGVEAVLPDGTVLDCLKTLRKDNTGMDLKQLFIGSEGTLGIITKVALQCAPRPAAVHTVMLAVPDFAAVQLVHALARRHLAEVLSAFEFLDQASVRLALEHVANTRDPFGALRPMYVIVETSGSCGDHDMAKLEGFVEACEGAGITADALLAQAPAERANIWAIRESVSESLQKHGTVYKYDLSMSIAKMYELVEAVRARLARLGPDVVVTGYGHVGDGNLHLNVSDGAHRDSHEILHELEPFVYEWTKAHQGSVSAEHGMGRLKRQYMGYSQSPEAIDVMRSIKQLFDPAGIMNPGKYLPDP